MARLSLQQKRFLDLLRSKSVGDRLSRQELIDGTGWSAKSLSTHLSKNKLVEFVEESSDGSFRILRTGETVTEEDIDRAMTQVSATSVTLIKGDILAGELGRYVLGNPLGAGAVGQVWKALDSDTDGAVAVKVMLPRPDLLDPARLGNVRQRFRSEAQQGKNLKHGCIVQVSDQGEYRGQPFLVMEFARQSVGSRIRNEGALDVQATLEIVRRCVLGLQYLHSCKCVHRDIKPDNLLEADRGVVVGDLGIVRWGDLSRAFTSAATMTRDSVQLGSWLYMAPEQQQSPHEAVPMSDVYSLGVTWYELLTGIVPSPAQFAAKRFPNPCGVPQINRLIGLMTNYSPDERPSLATIEQEIAALERLGPA